MAISNLNQGGDAVADADQIPIGQASSGQDRRVAAAALKAYAQLGLKLLPVPPAYANDAAAAAGGVPVGGLYRIGSAVQVRVV